MLTNFEIGDKVLITSDNWFFAPDGNQYKAVWGTLKGIHNSENVLGIKTNAKSTNWYIEIGNMLLAGCNAHMAIKTETVNLTLSMVDEMYEGELKQSVAPSRIYNADAK